jgi:hypothetical protein
MEEEGLSYVSSRYHVVTKKETLVTSSIPVSPSPAGVSLETSNVPAGLPMVVDWYSLASLIKVQTQQIAHVMHSVPYTDKHSGATKWGFNKNTLYHCFEVPKPQTAWEKANGIQRVRKIQSPQHPLKEIQRGLADHFWSHFPIPDCATAYRDGTCIADTAVQHFGTELVICIDLQDFFTSIKEAMIRRYLLERGYGLKIAKCISELCCFHNFLPQGSPCSPIVSNIIGGELFDGRILEVSARLGFHYTRYADDLIFSAQYPGAETFSNAGNMVQAVTGIVGKHGFLVAAKKTKFMRPPKRQIVLGMIVNRPPAHDPAYNGEPFVRISMPMYKKLRAMLHDAAQNGVTAAAERSNMTPHVFMRYVQGYLGSFMKQCDERRYFNLIQRWEVIKADWRREDSGYKNAENARLPGLL